MIARQDGVCANPGCGLTHLEIHHVAWWGRDHGNTDLENLIGICSRCHHLVHQNRLTIRPDGHGPPTRT
ncbi:HNH endonuclease signature motif containing protein [Solicola gregarius]|uniref:HNH endonuclease n=1 Tax=Solicola gregarius TaxID=2908642 RepID=A0AA46TMG0_9ACTN|nr:HNH endonuclease signature motif containing protein [Solicola gregarius]UYM07833.1 HNH endonuclease [Solicola gregarius]